MLPRRMIEKRPITLMARVIVAIVAMLLSLRVQANLVTRGGRSAST
jgi:hypothetical protein